MFTNLLNNVSEYIKRENLPIYEIAFMGEGFPLSSARFIPGNRSQNVYSVAKVFVVTALGMLFDEGRISTDDRLMDFLADEVDPSVLEKADKRWFDITIDDALKHRIGLPAGYLDIDCTDPSNPLPDDYLGYVLKTPFSREPRGESVYTDAAYYLLARVAEKIAGCTLDNFLWERLFYPLGFAEAAWSHCPRGHVIGATGLYISAADAVKLGEVYRCGGVYNGKKILSPEWVDIVLKRQYELAPFGIGDGYGKGGMLGQQLAVFPDKGISVAWTGYEFKGTIDLLSFIFRQLC